MLAHIGEETLELERATEDLFVGELGASHLGSSYLLESHYPDGAVVVGHDPYAFLPSLGELDLHLLGEGRHEHLRDVLGARAYRVGEIEGTAFSVWAPSAQGVALVGDFNAWNPLQNPMRSLGSSGIWELFMPGIGEGARYKFAVFGRDGMLRHKADPLAHYCEHPPRTASVVTQSRHHWSDEAYLTARATRAPWREPMSIYEVHLGSWRQGLSYRELAEQLGAYVAELGFTHVELMPVMEHPFSGSWGYQVTGFFAPTSRFGTPDEFAAMVDAFHQQGLGVILDWVPAHFPRDEWSLARFDGTALYEHEDERRGAHPDWGTLIFNHGRNEVRNFLISSAREWIEHFHADGLRVDAVASMLYLDYSRREGEWIPNRFGGREDLEALEFLREMNSLVYRDEPGVMTIAEESTAWPGVSRPVSSGGLGFGFKWNMGWMHDTLEYFSKDPIHRRYHHGELTFSAVYAFSENFVLPLSHDEVVHGKASLLNKMPGDRWQQLANLRALYGYMYAHPGKKLLFMGNELAQEHEWSHERSLEWHLLESPEHRGIHDLVRDLNHRYREQPALYELDTEPAGFDFIEANDASNNVIAFLRWSADNAPLLCVCNLSPVPRYQYRVGVPVGGIWHELLNTDSAHYGGSNVGNNGEVETSTGNAHGYEQVLTLTLPPLATLWLVPDGHTSR